MSPRRLAVSLPPTLRTGTVLTGVGLLGTATGTVAWAIATRVLSAHDLGIGAASLSFAILVGGGSHAGLNYGVVRYADRSGPRTADLINATSTWVFMIAAILAVAIAAGEAIVLGLPLYPDAFWLAAAIVSWGLFTFGDPIELLAGDEAGVVVRNMVVNVMRVALVPLLVAPFGHLTFVVALAVSGFAGTVLTVKALLPRTLPGYRLRPKLRFEGGVEIWRYSMASYVAAFVGSAAGLLMPVLVFAFAGSLATAYFSIAWVIAGVVALAPTALSASIFLHASREGEVPWRHLYLGVLTTSGLAILAVLTSGLWRPFAYSILGPQYEEGTALAGNLLLLSAIPLGINSALTAALRYMKALRALLFAALATAGAVVALTALLTPPFGVTGASVGFLAGEAIGSLAFVALAVRAKIQG